MNLRAVWIVLVAMAAISGLIGRGLQAADDANSRVLAGLLERRLYTPAAELCQQQLSRPKLDDHARQFWLGAQVQIETALALAADIPERDERWKAALASAATLAASNSAPPGSLAAQIATAAVHLAHGEQLARDAEYLAGDENRFAPARAELATAEKLLRATATDVNSALAGKITPAERTDLEKCQQDLACSLSRTLRLQALGLPAGGVRSDLLAQAQKQLQPLLELRSQRAGFWESRLEMLAVLQALQNTNGARQLRAALADANPPADVARHLRAEHVRLELASGRIDVAKELARDDNPPAFVPPADGQLDLDWARLEVLAAEKEVAVKDQAEADLAVIEKEGQSLVAELSRRYGPAWGRRAELLLKH